MTRLQKAATIIALAIFFVGAVAGEIWQASYSPQSPSQRTATEQHYSSENKTEKKGDTNRNEIQSLWTPNDSIGLYTLVLSVFTAVLAVATISLGILSFFQIRLARAEFISTHRPKLIVRQFVLSMPILPDQVIKVELSAVNIGATEAVWRYVGAEVALWNGQYWEAPGLDHFVKPISLPPIKNGQRTGMTIQSRFNITADQIAAVEQKKMFICAVGEFTYADTLGTQRRTGFRRNYDSSSDMFEVSPYSDHEYQD